jgi:Holliday junction resolvase RusA-like endonuclease
LPFIYWVFGRPVSTRNEDGGKPAGLAKWRGIVNTAAAEAVERASKGRGLVLEEALVQLHICWLSADPSDPSQPDIDNMLKPLIDALNKTVIADDRQVHRILAEKASINSPPSSIGIVMRELQDDERFVDIGEVTVVTLSSFASENEL